MRHCRFISSLCFLLLLPLASCVDDGPDVLGPAAQFDQAEAIGPYEVGFTWYMLTDASRSGRKIPVYVWYPVDPADVTAETPRAQYPLEPFLQPALLAPSSAFETQGITAAFQEPPAAGGAFPLILYTAGWGAPGYSSGMFLAEMVRHGYVLVTTTHWGDRAAPVAVPGEPAYGLYVAAYQRPRDMVFVLNDVLQKNAEAGLLQGVIDPAGIYASGWSLGGYTAIVLAAGDDGLCTAPAPQCGPTPADPRIRSLILFDPSYQLLTFAEIARVRVPTLTIGEEWNDLIDNWGMPAGWQARGHAAISGHPNYRVDVTPTLHLSFASLCETIGAMQVLSIPNVWPAWVAGGCSPPMLAPSEMRRLMNQYVLAFLTHDQSVLTPGFALAREPNIEFFVAERRSPSSIDVNYPELVTYFMHQPGRGHGTDVVTTGSRNPGGPPADGFGLARLGGYGLH